MIGFVSPWMAWGALAAVGLPVSAHLLSKTRYREVVFPAARLVQQAVFATSRIETPRHRLLMLLRCLILLLLVLVFMRPQWTPDARAIDDEQGIALILLIDASASMKRAADGATLYDRAQREAQRLLGQLDPARDVAAVIRVDHAPASLLPEATAQFSLLAERLNSTQPGYTHTNWPAAIALAQRLTRDEPRAVRLVTFSDQQGEQPAIDADHIPIPGPIDNTAIRLVDVRPYPAIQGQPITATVEVRHFGDQPLTAQLVAAIAANTSTQSLEVKTGATRRFELQLDPIQEGALLQITLDSPDAISADNITGAWLPVQTQTRALVVHDASNASATIAKRFATLLNPGEVAGVTLPTVQTLGVNEVQAALASADAATLRTIVLINQGQLPDALSQSLETYAQAGGGVIQFVSDAAVDPSRSTTASGIDFDLEPLRLFEGPARAGLAALPWPGVGNTPIDERAMPILMDELERVIVAEMPRERGRLIAINAALSPEPGGLLAQPAFVVLFNELCRYASPGPALPVPVKPGEPIPPQLLNAAQIETPNDADATADRYTAPGAYAALNLRGEIEAVAWAQLALDESDTRGQSDWSRTPVVTNSAAVQPGVSDGLAASLRQNPIELWPYFVLAMLGLVATESLLLRRFSGPRAAVLQGGVA